MKRKYHSGLMPAGAATKGSALTPRFHGKTAANAPNTARATYHAIISRSMKLGKNFISRLADGFSVHCTSSLGGTYSTAQSACETSLQPPFAFNGQVSVLILSRYPL